MPLLVESLFYFNDLCFLLELLNLRCMRVVLLTRGTHNLGYPRCTLSVNRNYFPFSSRFNFSSLVHLAESRSRLDSRNQNLLGGVCALIPPLFFGGDYSCRSQSLTSLKTSRIKGHSRRRGWPPCLPSFLPRPPVVFQMTVMAFTLPITSFVRATIWG